MLIPQTWGSKMTFAAFLFAYSTSIRKHPHLRCGQYMCNLLYEVRPDLADRIRGTAIDPFYLDERIPDFLSYVGDNW